LKPKTYAFISDLHLQAEEPEKTNIFLRFLQSEAKSVDELFILGDLFEYWVGDDQADEPCIAEIILNLRKLTKTGTKVAVMHGNRDFLIGQKFSKLTGVSLLPDEVLIDIHGQRALLLHGDTLCTDDIDYQSIRAVIRNPAWRREFLKKPIGERKQIARSYRLESESAKKEKGKEIMDVSLETLYSTLREWNYPLLIHGHTHRPQHHAHEVDGANCARFVLADWSATRGHALVFDKTGFREIDLS
jgi:UDP-2,3-diacylglucosamine hydrolase